MCTRIILLIVMVATTGCATMFVNADDRVIVRTDTKKAKLYHNGKLIGRKSASFRISHYGSNIIEAKKRGCTADMRTIDKRYYLGWFLLGNCLLNFCSGMLFDLVSGAWIGVEDKYHELEPDCD